MWYVGIDLHKHSITVCLTDSQCPKHRIQRFACNDVERIRVFFASLVPFEAVIEATASYEWLFELIEPLATRVRLANPRKLRIIAESTNKSDKLDARILAEFLARDMIPEAYRPTPRQRQHRALVRYRQTLQRMKTQVSNKIRRILSDYNADRRDLFTKAGLSALAVAPLSDSDRFIVDDPLAQRIDLEKRLATLKRRLFAFSQEGSESEQRQRELLRSIPGVGPITTDVVLAELGDVHRFRSAKQVVAYAGLALRCHLSVRRAHCTPLGRRSTIQE
jgi:transposase